MSLETKRELVSLLEEKERRNKAKFIDSIDPLNLNRTETNELYDDIMSDDNLISMRKLILKDLFFLMTRICKRKDMDHDWLFERCHEIQQRPDGHLDLWAREHYKSTIITFGKSIQDLLADPDHTLIGIFSHTRPIAKGFLEQIKREFEQNKLLYKIFPDILYENPKNEAPKWSLDSGLILKRKTNPKEANVEAWGLVDGQPTGKHFTLLIYDDVVTRESVTTPEQIQKVTAAWELSLNLGAQGGKKRYIGTRYHINDTYRVMMDRGSVVKRIKPATDNGKMDGNSVFMPQDLLMEKRRDMGPYTFGTQMLQDPVADRAMSFKDDWLKFYDSLGSTNSWNKYLLVDPASKRKKTSDYTVMMVIALAPDKNYYLIDGIRDRLNLTQRAEKLIEFHRKHSPLKVGYEEYGSQADIEHIEYVMNQKNYRFDITALGGSLAKEDRIQKLVPIYEQRRFYLPKALSFVDYENRVIDLIQKFLDDEYRAFPVTVHDDMLDCMARVVDPVLGADFPKASQAKKLTYGTGGPGSWMG